ncbi:MAG: helix-turn-helix domain-containing protein [Variovorax sp.]|nr:helix-turn-helix domain-containing protein [Variovorax sp.]
MIERASEFGASAAVPLVGGDSANMSAGDMLREAREAHGLHIDVVAAALKVSPQKLMALESDDIEALPDPVFARALAASLCRALRIDPAPVLAKLPGAQRPGLAEADQTLGKTLRSASPRAGVGAGGRPSRPLVVVVVLLLLGAAVLFWLPQSLFDQVGESISRMTHHDASGDQAATKPEAAPAGAPAEAVAPAAAPEPAPVAAAPEPAPEAAAPAAAPPSDLIVFTARDDTWISVTEAGGKQLLHRTVKAGETVGLNGTLPLVVVVGRAAGVEVQVRGKPFDLAPLTRSGGVARFDVKP